MKLNRQQETAVQHIEGPILVLAGAGSGKTRIIVNRIHRLITTTNVPPWQILAITFTNKAANEMRERIAAMPGIAEPEKITIGTFHSICARILRIEHAKFHFHANFSIVDEADQVSRIKKAIRETGYNPDIFTSRSVLPVISRAKNRFETPESMRKNNEPNPFFQAVSEIFRIYQRDLQADQSLDFDDLILKTVRLFEEEPGILNRYQNKYRYILIDEYQDTNNAQYEFVRLLGRCYRNIMAVGDDDQSIYRWRGAEISNILNFPNDFPGTKIIKLEQNYRSTQTILSAASALLSHNKIRNPKNLWTENKGGGPITCWIWPDDRVEAEAIGREIEQVVLDTAASHGDFAVFFRVNNQARILEEVFHRLRLPYQLIGNTSFFKRKEVKDLLAYIRLVLNPHDSGACRRILNVPRRGIGKKTIDILEKITADNECDLYAAIEKAVNENMMNDNKLQMLTAFQELIEKLICFERTHDAVEFVEYLLKTTHYTLLFEKENSRDASASLEIVCEFENAVADYARRGDGKLAGFADYLSLYSDDDQEGIGTEKEYVQLMTLHNAKGLEFPNVFIAGLEENLCPLIRKEEETDPAALEEERRLLYVGMTRAKQNLFLFGAEQRSLYGRVVQQQPSRFLNEIPDDCKTAPAGQNVKTNAGKIGRNSSCKEYKPGDRVRHPSLGSGTVVQCSGIGPEARIAIYFDRVGRKKLIAGLANLVRLN